MNTDLAGEQALLLLSAWQRMAAPVPLVLQSEDTLTTPYPCDTVESQPQETDQ